MRLFKRKPEPKGPLPALRVTYRYALGPSVGFSSTVCRERSVDDICGAIEEMRRKDAMLCLGIADDKGHEIVAFPARSILDIKIRLATEDEIRFFTKEEK